MTWTALLLADPSPCLRRLVLRELLGRPDDDLEVRELAAMREADPPVADLLRLQEPGGSWKQTDLVSRGDKLRATSLALTRLGYLGFGPDCPAVRRGTGYLFAQRIVPCTGLTCGWLSTSNTPRACWKRREIAKQS
jgi:hypothetical protein